VAEFIVMGSATVLIPYFRIPVTGEVFTVLARTTAEGWVSKTVASWESGNYHIDSEGISNSIEHRHDI
jgi:hypothetical protein